MVNHRLQNLGTIFKWLLCGISVASKMIEVLKKIAELCFSIFALIFLTFLILRLLPGGPFDDEIHLHPLVRQKLEEAWSLESNFFTQFFSYFISVLKLEFGYSLSYPGRSVASLIFQKLGFTFKLNLIALFVVCVVASIWSYLSYRHDAFSKIFYRISQIFLSLPALFIGPMLIYIFGFYFQIFPVAFLTSPLHYFLPVMILSFRPIAFLYRLHSKNQAAMAHSDFVVFARAKGLSENHIYFRHILKNTLPLVFSYFPSMIVSIFSGSFLVEMLFSVPGMGLVFVEAISSRDYPLILGVTLFLGVIMVFLTQFFHFIFIKSDPRMKAARGVL